MSTDNENNCLHCHILDAIEKWMAADGKDVRSDLVEIDAVADALAEVLGQMSAQFGTPRQLGETVAELAALSFSYHQAYKACVDPEKEATHPAAPAGAKPH